MCVTQVTYIFLSITFFFLTFTFLATFCTFEQCTSLSQLFHLDMK